MFLVIHTYLKFDGPRTVKTKAIFRSYSSKADITANFCNNQKDGHTIIEPHKLATYKPELPHGEVIASHHGSTVTTIVEILHMDQVSEI